MFIIIGNILSFAAAVFTILSSLSEGRKKIYGYQAVQCAVMIAASFFFGSYAAVVTFVLCVLRNILLAADRFSRGICIVFIAALTVSGIAANNLGAVGLLPVITTDIYTFLCLVLREDVPIKLNIIQNLVLWTIYDIIVLDLVSAAVDSVSVIATVAAVIKTVKKTGQRRK